MKHKFGFTKPYGLANQKLCYIQMLLNKEKSREQDQEGCREWLVNTGPECHTHFRFTRNTVSFNHQMKQVWFIDMKGAD